MASDKKLVKRYGKIADEILALEPEMKKLKDEDFLKKTESFKAYLQEDETHQVEDILVEAYAVAREAAFRVSGMNAYRVQLIGGIILNNGDVAQMRTGEGKTLTGIFPAYLNALTGKGVHVVTVNEYLSRRDAEINGHVYDLLGITVGVNGSNLTKNQKRDAYAQDITYTTNSEIGFDYLKDNMVMNAAEKVQRGLNYAIIDEADSVLIDEARTPLIISGGATSSARLYERADDFAKTLSDKEDVEIDQESKQVYLTEQGMQKAKEYFSVKNLFDLENTELFHLILNALKANFTFKEGIEYSVSDGEIKLIDQFTGRIMEGRSYSDGLQQALQAKEHLEVEEETSTLATITYQNFYRLYTKLSGMTGTAKTEEEEFIKIYNMRVIVVPTNKPLQRKDEIDLTFGTKNAALKWLMKDVQEMHDHGNPILIGTTSVESSEQVARYLEKSGFHFEMINAKNHAREADIIAQAGQKGAITLATNMAGRGTDIKLGKGVADLGGLIVFGVERNEARRIDDQLRGRSGRQGDPGTSRFYISMEDDLMARFTPQRTRNAFLKLGDENIKSRIFTRSISNAQKKLEGMNFDQRKNVLDYDNILAQQREAMYAQRDDILTTDQIDNVIQRMFYTTAYELVIKHSDVVQGERSLNAKALIKAVDGVYVAKNALQPNDFENLEPAQAAKVLTRAMMKLYREKLAPLDQDMAREMVRNMVLRSFDKYWTKQINLAGKLKSGIYLQQYAQNNPLAEYVEQATTLYNKMKVDIANEVTEQINESINKEVEVQRPQVIEITDDDIEEIFRETGLGPQDLNFQALEEKFDHLIDQATSEEEKRRLSVQRDILHGLVIELQKRQAQYRRRPEREITLSQEEVNNIAHKWTFDLDSPFTVDQVNQIFSQFVQEHPNLTMREIDQVNFDHEVLVQVAQAMSRQTLQAKVAEIIETPNQPADELATEEVITEEVKPTQAPKPAVKKPAAPKKTSAKPAAKKSTSAKPKTSTPKKSTATSKSTTAKKATTTKKSTAPKKTPVKKAVAKTTKTDEKPKK